MKTKTTTVRWDSTEKERKVKAIARRTGIGSVNRLVNSWADTVIAQEAAEASFRAAAGRGDPARLLKLLDKLDAQDVVAGIKGTRP